MPSRYENVSFEFVSAGEKPSLSHGTVLVRDDAMVLEVELDGDRPYVIEGRPERHYFRGRHVGLTDDTPTEAKWTEVGGEYLGLWVEDGNDYLFRFRLPLGSPTDLASRPAV